MATYDLELLEEGAILAFQDEDHLTLGLGVVVEANRPGGTAAIRTPLQSVELVRSVRVGSAHWDWYDTQENVSR
jgi:hypothetical protein